MREVLRRYLAQEHKEGSPRISIYLPTSRSMPEVKGDPIVYKNLLQKAKGILEEKYPRRSWESLLKRLEEKQGDPEFWRYNKDGLVLLADEDGEEVFRVDVTFRPTVVVAGYFYVLPLLKVIDSDVSVVLLDLSKDRLRLYNVHHYVATPFEQEEIKTSFNELFDDFDSHGNLNFGSYSGSGDSSAYHGHRARPEELEKDRDKYFRYVDQKLGEWKDRNSLPVLLSGTRENIARFRSLAKGDFYLDESIDKPFDSMEINERRELLQEVLSPRQDAKIQKYLDEYGQKASQGLLIGGVENIHPIASFGRIEKLFVQDHKAEEDRTKLSELTEGILLSGGDVVLLKDKGLRGNVSATLRY